jgi:hypothetical protein
MVENDPMDRGKLQVQFHPYPVKNPKRSAEEGRPIYENVDYVRIFVPGDKDNIVDRQVEEIDTRRFAREYQAYKAGKEAPIEGTPLEMWPTVDRAQVAELVHFNVRTVEQLANLSDANCQNFKGILALRQKARDYLAQAAGNAPLEKMRAELSAREAENAALWAETERLKTQLKELADKMVEIKKSKKE